MAQTISRDVFDLVRERDRIDREAAALRERRKVIDEKIIALVTRPDQPYYSWRFGDTILRVKPSEKLTLRPASEGIVFDFLQEHAPIRQLASFNSLRIGQVKAVAGDHYRSVDENGEIHQGWSAMRRDHFDHELGLHELVSMPIDRAPLFLQRLNDTEGTAR